MITVITQNIEDVYNNEQGRKILGNAEFAMILKQKATDRDTICNILIYPQGKPDILPMMPRLGRVSLCLDLIRFRSTIQSQKTSVSML